MATSKIPVILDTDIGSDIDDTWALAFLLRSPELDLKLVTSATPDGAYRAWISEFDAGVGPFAHRQATARFNQAMQNKIRQEYAFQVIHRQQRDRGRTVERQRLPSGEIEVTIAGYR